MDAAPPSPSAGEWATLGLHVVDELHGGFQSRVLRVDRDGEPLVIKLTDRRYADRAFFARLGMLESLAAVEPLAVGPLRIAAPLAVELGGWIAVAYPFVGGRDADPALRADVEAMAGALAQLHRSLRQLDAADDIPPVATLRSVAHDPARFGNRQLLHGDFNTANVKVSAQGVRVIDFDDAGYGPVEFELGNTLYMVLFDTSLNGEPATYRAFRDGFVEVYAAAVDKALDVALIDASVELRKRALAAWLDDLSSAPIGIRTATPEWREQLRRFVSSS